MASGVPTGVFTPIDVLVPRGGDPDATAARLARLPGVVTAVAPDTPAWRRDGTALITIVPVAEGGSAAGKETVRRVRGAVPAGAGVGGTAAIGVDFAEAVYGAFPLMPTLIALATFVLLARAFRSLLLPLKAVLLNLLSLAAVLGTMVLVWQYGYGSKPIWGIAATGSITEFVPVMVFATGLGLGVLLDATVIRALLVPALVSLFGRWNWWLPGWAARALRVRPAPLPPAPAPEPVAAGR